MYRVAVGGLECERGGLAEERPLLVQEALELVGAVALREFRHEARERLASALQQRLLARERSEQRIAQTLVHVALEKLRGEMN